LTDAHGRDHVTNAKMGFDAEGNIVALQANTFANMGAYLSTFAPAVPTYLHGTLLQGLYTTPKINVDVTASFTHTNAVDAYRGAGRPEAISLLGDDAQILGGGHSLIPTLKLRLNTHGTLSKRAILIIVIKRIFFRYFFSKNNSRPLGMQ